MVLSFCCHQVNCRSKIPEVVVPISQNLSTVHKSFGGELRIMTSGDDARRSKISEVASLMVI